MNAAAGLVIGTAAWGLPATWLAVVYYSALVVGLFVDIHRNSRDVAVIRA
ncbi:hypothetical protein [Mycobacterium sp.]|nr:hypothetical protein [Mycobacterium sp.]HKP43973.1 hypothetical protein [Mycobacterium sp.]